MSKVPAMAGKNVKNLNKLKKISLRYCNLIKRMI